MKCNYRSWRRPTHQINTWQGCFQARGRDTKRFEHILMQRTGADLWDWNTYRTLVVLVAQVQTQGNKLLEELSKHRNPNQSKAELREHGQWFHTVSMIEITRYDLKMKLKNKATHGSESGHHEPEARASLGGSGQGLATRACPTSPAPSPGHLPSAGPGLGLQVEPTWGEAWSKAWWYSEGPDTQWKL